jgi:hypothetical protein
LLTTNEVLHRTPNGRAAHADVDHPVAERLRMPANASKSNNARISSCCGLIRAPAACFHTKSL